MPDNKIFEAMIENQLTDLLEQSKDASKFTPLEAKLIPLVVERIREFPNPEERQKRANNYTLEVEIYVSLLECCDSAEQYSKKGYSPLNSNVPQDSDYARLNDKKLQELTKIGIVQLTNAKLRKTTMLEVWEDDKIISNNPLEEQRFWPIYRITEEGKAILEEHRKIKEK